MRVRIARTVSQGSLNRTLVSISAIVSGVFFIVLMVASDQLQAEQALTAEFLEFLGEYEQFGDEWVDPYSFAENLEQMARLGKDEQTPSQKLSQERTQKLTQKVQTQQKQFPDEQLQQGNAEQRQPAVGGPSQ